MLLLTIKIVYLFYSLIEVNWLKKWFYPLYLIEIEMSVKTFRKYDRLKKSLKFHSSYNWI